MEPSGSSPAFPVSDLLPRTWTLLDPQAFSERYLDQYVCLFSQVTLAPGFAVQGPCPPTPCTPSPSLWGQVPVPESWTPKCLGGSFNCLLDISIQMSYRNLKLRCWKWIPIPPLCKNFILPHYFLRLVSLPHPISHQSLSISLENCASYLPPIFSPQYHSDRYHVIESKKFNPSHDVLLYPDKQKFDI